MTGEFKIIEMIRRGVKTDKSVIVGIGDDGAVLQSEPGTQILITTDMLIENRHFRRSQASPYEIGWKAMAVNLSDIAAMGGTPMHAVVAAGLPASLNMGFLKELYRGLRAAAKRFGVNIVGGDTNRSDKIVLAVTLLGRVAKGRAVKRSGAKAGDWIFVSGPLGGSYASKKHLRFMPRLDVSGFLMKNYNPHAMMDLSDGLASDLRRLTEESRVGARIDSRQVPVARAARNFSAALNDGEDFELLFTLAPSEGKKLISDRRLKGLVRIGEIVRQPGKLTLVLPDGKEKPFPKGGFDHFR